MKTEIQELAEKQWKESDFIAAVGCQEEELQSMKEGYILGYEDGYNKALKDFRELQREQTNKEIQKKQEEDKLHKKKLQSMYFGNYYVPSQRTDRHPELYDSMAANIEGD